MVCVRYMMFPPTASVWTSAEREAIQAFESSKTKSFTPQWGTLRPKDFSQFHYMVNQQPTKKSEECDGAMIMMGWH